MEFLTFFLAVSGYATLTVACVLAGRRGEHIPRGLVRATAFIVVTHVVMVWTVRYQWQFELATRNGFAPFLIFHTALALIVAAAFVGNVLSRRFLWTAFPVVTLGALGAVFTYDFVALYRVPVVVLGAIGMAGIGRGVLASRLRMASP
jgi:hypothetical protein